MKITEAKETIKKFYETDELRKTALLLEGPPGVGKTQIVKELTKELGIGLKVVYLISKRPIDFGLPETNSGSTAYFTEKINASVVVIPERDGEKGILLYDEFLSAPQMVQIAVQNLILERKLGDYEVPSGWMIILTGNRTGENIVNQLLPATVNRICKVEIDYDEEDFISYGTAHNYPKEVLAFFVKTKSFKTTNFDDYDGQPFPSPRSIEKAVALINTVGYHPELLCGTIGKIAYNLIAFKNEISEMPELEVAMKEKSEVIANYKPSWLYSYIMEGLTKIEKEPEITFPLGKFFVKMPKEFTLIGLKLLVKKLVSKNDKTFLIKLASDPDIKKIVSEFSELFKGIK